MKNLESLNFDQLERTPRNWDGRTKNIIVHIGGAGNMFGGSSRMVHAILHGENSSIGQSGELEIVGVIQEGRNLARGSNGPNSQQVKYYRGHTDFNTLHTVDSTFDIIIKGTSQGGTKALCSILGASEDWLIH